MSGLGEQPEEIAKKIHTCRFPGQARFSSNVLLALSAPQQNGGRTQPVEGLKGTIDSAVGDY